MASNLSTRTGTDAMPAPAAPHPNLTDYYPTPAERRGFVRTLFNNTAGDYDRINRIFALGSGGRHRRRALLDAGLRPGMRLLDVAVGTGLVAREAAGIVGPSGLVVGVDLSEGMLAEARRNVPGAPLAQAEAEALPLADASVDFLTMGYALRHVADLAVAFAEYRRVLRPGGTLLLLEISRPDNRFAYAALKAYLGHVVPAVCRWTASRPRSGLLMDYCWQTIDQCVPAGSILEQMHAVGFADVVCHTSLGIFRDYVGRRPLA